LILAVFIGYEAAIIFQPYFYFPNRYIRHPAPVLTIIMFPAAAAALPEMMGRFARQRWLKSASVLALSFLALAFMGGRGTRNAGLDICIDGNTKIYEFIGSLPPDALIAGRPSGVMDSVPYLSKRRAFVTFETHQAFHKGYVEEMRKRTRVLIDAYFATNTEPLIRLRDEFGVTHLIVDKRVYHDELSRRWYFKPFDEWAKRAHATGLTEGFEIQRQFTVAGVFSEGPYIVLELSRFKE
jgi:hypothetical protein